MYNIEPRFEVHQHSEFSNMRFRDCIIKTENIAKRALEIGLQGFALTDHEILAGAVKINKQLFEIRKENPNFKIAIGNEIYLIEEEERQNNIKHPHLILIAKDKEGYNQLKQLSSIAWMNSYYDKGVERVDTTRADLSKIIKSNPGHLIASTACLAGTLSSSVLMLEQARNVGNIEEENIAKNKIIDFVSFMKDLFKDDFYFEIAPSQSKEQIIVNKKILELSKVFQVKCVIGCDGHYLEKNDRYVHKGFLTSQRSNDQEVDEFYEYSYLQSQSEIIENLTPSISVVDDGYKELCANSMEIYDKIEIYSIEHKPIIPKVDVKDYPLTKVSYLQEKYPNIYNLFNSSNIQERYWINEVYNSLKEKELWTEEYIKQIETESDVLNYISNNLDDCMYQYFNTFKDCIDLFWECDSVVGPGRGSATGFLSDYALGITQLDPIKRKLSWWRFLNKERAELPDIDIDLDATKRPAIIKQIKERRKKYLSNNLTEQEKNELGITYVATYRTESSKSAVLNSCRGYRSKDCPDGIDVDTAQYLSSLIPAERGFVFDLHTTVYGDKEKDRKPITEFVNTVNEYPGLLEIMFGIEGLISGRGIHASGVIMFQDNPYDTQAFMKAPNGEIMTQLDLHTAEFCGGVKFDFLVTEATTKIGICIKLLQEYNELEKISLREIYNKYLHPEVLDIKDRRIWKALSNGEVLDVFQFSSDIGLQAAKKIKPSNPVELTIANAMMRLMPQDKDAEPPIDKYVRFKNNFPTLMIEEQNKYHLTIEERNIVKDIYEPAAGTPCTQEDMMTILMRCCGFSLGEANWARKICAKKVLKDVPKVKEKMYENMKDNTHFVDYIWDTLIYPQMSYSFSGNHAMPYSFVGIQELVLATKWNMIYWNTACLLVNSGSVEITGEEDKNKSNDYGKTATALNKFLSNNIKISLIDINKSGELFKPDAENNTILYGLKAISGMNNETIAKIYAGRPYKSFKDFLNKCSLDKTQMLNLIKAGAFDNVDDILNNRIKILTYYLSIVSNPKKKLTLQNLNGLIEKNLFPQQQFEKEIKTFHFNKYLKTYCKHNNIYIFNDSCSSFYEKFFGNEIDSLEVINGYITIEQKKWKDLYDNTMLSMKTYIQENYEEMLSKYNFLLFKELWDKYADNGNLSKMEMQAVCFYYHNHELSNVDNNKYGIVDFFSLDKDSEIDYFFKRGGRDIPIYKLSRIAGTVIAKNDNRSSITLLTTTGVVVVKMSKSQYAKYKAQLSQIDPITKTKKVMEKSWFKRGNILMITGYRREDEFVMKTYKSTQSHSLYKITEILDKEVRLQHERWAAEDIIEEDID